MTGKLNTKLVALGVTAALMGGVVVGCSAPASEEAAPSLVNSITDKQGVSYRLYVGLLDNDTQAQELSMHEAKELIVPLFAESESGYTVFEAEGGFKTDTGEFVRNDTLVFDGVHGDEQAVIDLINKIKETANVASVFVESTVTGSKIYGGQETAVS